MIYKILKISIVITVLVLQC